MLNYTACRWSRWSVLLAPSLTITVALLVGPAMAKEENPCPDSFCPRNVPPIRLTSQGHEIYCEAPNVLHRADIHGASIETMIKKKKLVGTKVERVWDLNEKTIGNANKERAKVLSKMDDYGKYCLCLNDPVCFPPNVSQSPTPGCQYGVISVKPGKHLDDTKWICEGSTGRWYWLKWVAHNKAEKVYGTPGARRGGARTSRSRRSK